MSPITIDQKPSDFRPADFARLVARARSLRSSTRWRIDNRALGHCGVTSLVANDRFGGDILRMPVTGGSHVYHRIDGTRMDFTASWFDGKLLHADVLAARDEAFADTNQQQYDAVRAHFADAHSRETH